MNLLIVTQSLESKACNSSMLLMTEDVILNIAAIGECMLELSPTLDEGYRLSFGGDTLNTAIYLARCGGTVDYVTALGDDVFSDKMIMAWRAEGVGTNYVLRKKHSLPGLYIIQNDGRGERSFHYWRNQAPAKSVFDDSPELFEALLDYNFLYLTGITLSLYSESTLCRLWDFLDRYRSNGGKVVFDINYRQRNWSSPSEALAIIKFMMKKTNIALPSYDDEITLYGLHSKQECLDRYLRAGAEEVVIKDGINGCLLHSDGRSIDIAVPKVLSAVDTTAAGDSFNGGYLAARLNGESPEASVTAGQQCAALVIQYPGAIIPLEVFNKGRDSYVY